MKKLYFYLVAAVMMIGATACQQDAVEGVKNEKPSFTATLNGTRTELGEGNKVMWNADDKIAVYTQENTAGVVFDGDATEAAATAKFTTTEEFVASTTGYLAVYPELKYDTSSYPPTSTIPAAEYADSVWSVPVHIGIEQDVTADGWDEKYNYMVAYSEDTNLSFQAATALIKFTYAGDAGLNATFYAEGAQLAGDAILNYNTADGSINYTTTGNSTNIDLFGLVPGETYYIPIYPGKVEYFQLSGYSGYMPATFYSYEGEFEFKAGKIYTVKAKEQSIPSPWTMMDPNMGTQASMSIDDNGYHVAKAVPAGNFVFYSWTDGVGEQFLSASKELGLYEWQATADDMAIAVSIPESNMFDVYLAPDASMFCVVEAGATVPEMPGHTIYFYNADNWTNVHFYCWDANDTHHTGAWPGNAMTKTMVGEVEYYAITLPYSLNDTQLNFIFNNNAGVQTADLSATISTDLYYLPNGNQVEDITNPVPPVSYKVYAYNYAGWSTLNFYAWGAYTNTWPGVKMTETEIVNGYTYNVFQLPATATGGSIQMIFNNGSAQTADSAKVTVDHDIYVRVNAGTVTFLEDPNNPEPEVVASDYKIYVKNTIGWSKMNIYAWNGLSTGGWPGTAMKQETIDGVTYYVHEFKGYGAVTGASIIFNNGSAQTKDITGVNLTKDLFYEVYGSNQYKLIDDPRQ